MYELRNLIFFGYFFGLFVFVVVVVVVSCFSHCYSLNRRKEDKDTNIRAWRFSWLVSIVFVLLQRSDCDFEFVFGTAFVGDNTVREVTRGMKGILGDTFIFCQSVAAVFIFFPQWFTKKFSFGFWKYKISHRGPGSQAHLGAFRSATLFSIFNSSSVKWDNRESGCIYTIVYLKVQLTDLKSSVLQLLLLFYFDFQLFLGPWIHHFDYCLIGSKFCKTRLRKRRKWQLWQLCKSQLEKATDYQQVNTNRHGQILSIFHRQRNWTRWRPRLRISSIMASK